MLLGNYKKTYTTVVFTASRRVAWIEGNRNVYRILWRNLKGGNHLKELVTDGISTSDSRETITVNKFVFGTIFVSITRLTLYIIYTVHFNN